MVIKEFIGKWRHIAEVEYNTRYKRNPTWRQAILESLFHPDFKPLNGKTCMSHLHPDLKNLHLPHDTIIADWRKYRVEDHPALVEFQKKCHAAGLHDPWLRSKAHYYYPGAAGTRSILKVVTTKMWVGFLVATALYIPKYLYVDYYKKFKFEHTPDYREKYGDEEVFHH